MSYDPGDFDPDRDDDVEGPADPFTSTDLQAGATMAHELFMTYRDVGFTDDQALYLTGCVVATISAAMQQAEVLGQVEATRQAAWQATMDFVRQAQAERRAHPLRRLDPNQPAPGDLFDHIGPDRVDPAAPRWDERSGMWVHPSDHPPAWATDPLIWGPPEQPPPTLTWVQVSCPKCKQPFYWAVNAVPLDPDSDVMEIERMRTALIMECPDHADRVTIVTPPEPRPAFTMPTPKCMICHGPLVVEGGALICPQHRTPGPPRGMGGVW
jgi:hypothetical protein